MAISCISDLARVHGAQRRDRVALRARDRVITYGDLDERTSRVGNALLAEGVEQQGRVAFLDKNGPEYFDVLIGGAKVNAVDVAVNWRLAPPEVAYIVNDSQATVFVVGEEFLPVLDAIEGELTTVKKIVVVGSHPSHESFEDWIARHDGTDPGLQAGPHDVALQFYSSGTTGLPKGVMLTNANLFTAMDGLSKQLGFTPDSVNLVAMPLFHIGGGGWACVGLTAGCEDVIVREIDPVVIARIIEERGVTHAFLVPAVLQFMCMIPEIAHTDFSKLEMIAYGASPISTQVLEDSLRVFGCGFVQLYGLTETTGAVTGLFPDDHDPSGPNAHRLRSAGKPLAGVEIRIVDATTGVDADVNEVGEIWIRTVQNMKGYWNLDEETAKTILADGWLRSGDAGYLDADGYLYIHDRVKDMIVSGGENIYPAEIENVLMAHPAVADAAVIGVPSDRWGETPKALIVRAAGADPTEHEIIAFCRERLAKFKCPTSVEWVEELPRNPSGKILKKDLRAPYWEGRSRLVN
ncbi:MAG TPA: fatty acid--CoA ligase [Acidimicrobiales bacterium]|nr:fatty acid--CoA ligase [Acidimicrobiales bacterium]